MLTESMTTQNKQK